MRHCRIQVCVAICFLLLSHSSLAAEAKDIPFGYIKADTSYDRNSGAFGIGADIGVKIPISISQGASFGIGFSSILSDRPPPEEGGFYCFPHVYDEVPTYSSHYEDAGWYRGHEYDFHLSGGMHYSRISVLLNLGYSFRIDSRHDKLRGLSEYYMREEVIRTYLTWRFSILYDISPFPDSLQIHIEFGYGNRRGLVLGLGFSSPLY